MTQRDCQNCGQPIHPERLEAQPDTLTCTQCSTTPKVLGFMSPTASKGCASAIEIVDPRNQEDLRRAQRVHRRSR